MKPVNESKEERFCRLTNARVNKILTMIRLLGNLSLTSIYSYNRKQVEQIFTTLQLELAKAKMRFLQPEKKQRRRFSLGKPYEVKTPASNQAFAFPLPDGSYLRAVSFPNAEYPCINIYWDKGINEPSYPVCFAEYNFEKPEGQELCIGVYYSSQEDTQYYEPFHTIERNSTEKNLRDEMVLEEQDYYYDDSEVPS